MREGEAEDERSEDPRTCQRDDDSEPPSHEAKLPSQAARPDGKDDQAESDDPYEANHEPAHASTRLTEPRAPS